MGASAFPQNGGFNPSGTVAALTYWCADAIKGRYLTRPCPLEWPRDDPDPPRIPAGDPGGSRTRGERGFGHGRGSPGCARGLSGDPREPVPELRVHHALARAGGGGGERVRTGEVA